MTLIITGEGRDVIAQRLFGYDPRVLQIYTRDDYLTVEGLASTYYGDELIGEYNSAGTMLRRYVHCVGAEDPLLWYEGANMGPARWYHTDHQGSIVSL